MKIPVFPPLSALFSLRVTRDRRILHAIQRILHSVPDVFGFSCSHESRATDVKLVDDGAAAPAAAGDNDAIAEHDHQHMMDLLHITSLRRGRDGNDPGSPFYANYEEAKANPFTALPDPLRLNNGEAVTTAELWWQNRRPEIVEDFDREIYGRVPMDAPSVRWRILSVFRETNGAVPVLTK